MSQLRKLRKGKKISVKELADNVGISERYVSFLENNERTPSLKVAIKIADFLECSIEDIFLH